MTKNVKFKRLDGGVLMTVDDKKYVYTFPLYQGQSKIDEEFYMKAGSVIFDQSNQFNILCDNNEYNIHIHNYIGGYYVTIHKNSELVNEFVEKECWMPSSPRELVNGHVLKCLLALDTLIKDFVNKNPGTMIEFEINVL